jgi:DNA-binding LytR/AlgR family response regulator
MLREVLLQSSSYRLNPKALIAEDEPVLRAGLRNALAAAWPEIEIVALAKDGAQALQLLERHRPDVLFLDIQMPGLSGLQVAKAASRRCHVVFVTAYEHYAVAAFDQGAVDYVMKPFDIARLTTACDRVKLRLSSSPANLDSLLERLAELGSRNRGYLRWINVEDGRKVRLVTVDEVCYFQAADREALIRTPLKDLLEELDPVLFWQIHRSTIVNVNAIAEVDRDMRGRPFLHLKVRKERLPVSQPFAHLFRHM